MHGAHTSARGCEAETDAIHDRSHVALTAYPRDVHNTSLALVPVLVLVLVSPGWDDPRGTDTSRRQGPMAAPRNRMPGAHD